MTLCLFSLTSSSSSESSLTSLCTSTVSFSLVCCGWAITTTFAVACVEPIFSVLAALDEDWALVRGEGKTEDTITAGVLGGRETRTTSNFPATNWTFAGFWTAVAIVAAWKLELTASVSEEKTKTPNQNWYFNSGDQQVNIFRRFLTLECMSIEKRSKSAFYDFRSKSKVKTTVWKDFSYWFVVWPTNQNICRFSHHLATNKTLVSACSELVSLWTDLQLIWKARKVRKTNLNQAKFFDLELQLMPNWFFSTIKSEIPDFWFLSQFELPNTVF